VWIGLQNGARLGASGRLTRDGREAPELHLDADNARRERGNGLGEGRAAARMDCKIELTLRDPRHGMRFAPDQSP
jgi:hypothetical protein